MPTYEYSCLDCSHGYEKREGFEAPALQQCPSCGGTARRVIHAAPIVFKGSGFYITDNRKPAVSEVERSAPEAEAEARTGDSASKPATAGRDAEPAAAG